MERRSPLSFCFLLLLLLSTVSGNRVVYESLVLRPLSSPPTIDTSVSWSETLTQTGTDASADSASSSLSLQLRVEHRDSLALNSTPAELFNHRLNRDTARVESIVSRVAIGHGANLTRPVVNRPTRSFSSTIVSGLSQGSGEYFTRVGVGTPSRSMYMVLDTGSDVVWIQCSPCRKCYSQSDPLFNPTASSSFAGVPCSSPICRSLDESGCSRGRSCQYRVNYGDGSFTGGDFSTETLTFRRTTLPRVALGCGHDNEGLFVGAAGLLGLGRGELSFPTQAGRVFGRRFSYCLADRQAGTSRASTLVFGDVAVRVTGAIYTPMVRNPRLGTFYYVNLVGISVGGVRVAVASSEFQISASGNGGVIVDSGTSVTRLVQPAYIAMRDAFRRGTTHLKRTAAGYSLFDTCYDLSGQDVVTVPTVVFHFAGRGADLSFPANNYLVPVNSAGLFCFAFAGTASGLSIIGNIQQQGIRVVFDTVGSRVGFVLHAC